MPARHLSRVDLPLPLRPTIPKNSPLATSKDTSRSAGNCSVPLLRRGCSTRSLSVCVRSCGRRNVFETFSTVTARSPAPTRCERADTRRTATVPPSVEGLFPASRPPAVWGSGCRLAPRVARGTSAPGHRGHDRPHDPRRGARALRRAQGPEHPPRGGRRGRRPLRRRGGHLVADRLPPLRGPREPLRLLRAVDGGPFLPGRRPGGACRRRPHLRHAGVVHHRGDLDQGPAAFVAPESELTLR